MLRYSGDSNGVDISFDGNKYDITYKQAGLYEFTCLVTDTDNLSASATLAVTVTQSKLRSFHSLVPVSYLFVLMPSDSYPPPPPPPSLSLSLSLSLAYLVSVFHFLVCSLHICYL